jgi:hypothetical protein
MSLSDLAAIGSFVSGLAVLASLIFVGFQLRQNTQAVRRGVTGTYAELATNYAGGHRKRRIRTYLAAWPRRHRKPE